MHITKNVCANTLNTLMDTGGTSKDSLAIRLDMQHLGIRKELHPVGLEDGYRCFTIDSLPRGYLGQYVWASAYAELDG